ncbi:MAG: Hsp20/alpha crystallin family protein [Bacteroidales bacterium]|nr:Hsp20/alpha crystallin family protein [Bacteroidales bacterium]MDD3664233.1 Hsp20/alpha crystallin family protein [Bacteroidales bacterium]
MTIVRWRNLPTFTDMFDNLFEGEQNRLSNKQYDCMPAVNILENKEAFEIELAVPGMAKDSFAINLENNVLTISSDKETKAGEETNYTRREFVYGTFSRSFTLPKTVDSEKISADYEHGILKVKLPKKEEVKLTRQITIG